jgi:hypothetical protein
MGFLKTLREQAGQAGDAKPFLQQLKEGAEHASDHEHEWMPKLRKIKGRIGPDKVERISTKDVFDRLEVPQRKRAQLWIKLSRMMNELGWGNIKARGLNDQAYLSQVRGYARPAPGCDGVM